jgi:hypothetical protein
MVNKLFFDGQEYDENHERGYRDAQEGFDFDPPFGSPAAIQGYRDGWDEAEEDQASREDDVR